MKDIIKKYLTREIIVYVIAGALTTLVNLLATYLLFNICKIEENTTTVIAWIVAVLFAYFINNYWVFVKKYISLNDEIRKIGKFIGSRLLTLVIEEGSVFVFITLMGLNFWLIKIILMVVVTVLNYIFSKIFVFRK